MRVDSHQHFWRYDRARDAWITDEMRVLQRDYMPSDLARELQRNRIDATVAVQADQSEDETLFLLNLAKTDPTIAGVVGWVDLRAPNIAERLRYFSQFDALCGFRHIAQSEADPEFLIREDFLSGIARLGEFGFTYDILVYPEQLPAAVKLAQKYPQQPFVLDHIAKPRVKTGEDGGWEKHVRTLARLPNVYCKVSGLVTEADWRKWRPEDFNSYLDVIFESFHAERLMFGSDWPVCLLAANYSQVCELADGYVRHFSASGQEAFWGGNTVRFYGLKVTAHGPTA